MAESTAISWTRSSWNPWLGCTKVSPGCLHCYAESLNLRWKKGVKAAGRSLMDSGRDELDSAASRSITPVQYRKGGKVRKTGGAIVHKGERVIPKSKVKRVEKMMRKSKMRMKAKRG